MQLCSDALCMTAVTDFDGAAVFSAEPGDYTAHILLSPRGFLADQTGDVPLHSDGEAELVLTGSFEGEEIAAPMAGFAFTVPSWYNSAEGFLDWTAEAPDYGIMQVTLSYYAVSYGQLDAYNSYLQSLAAARAYGGNAPTPPVPGWGSGYEGAVLFELFGLDASRSLDELLALLRAANGPDGAEFAFLEEVGHAGDTTFYVGQYALTEQDKALYESNMGRYYPEFEALRADRDTFIARLKLSEPQHLRSTAPGASLSFTATTFDGEAVSSADLFAGHKVTMINLWATWCYYCVEEMEALEQLSREFEAEGCQIIGLCLDAADPDGAQNAQNLLAQKGVTYPNFVAPANVARLLPYTGIPTSYFVDSEGHFLTEPVVGAVLDQYSLTLSRALDALN